MSSPWECAGWYRRRYGGHASSGSSSSSACSLQEGTTVLKCFLHISAEEQRKQLAERLSDPTKRWKYDPKDEETNRRFGEFMAAYEEALTATSTAWAPWFVIPADRNWVRNLAVATVLVEALRHLDPQFPD